MLSRIAIKSHNTLNNKLAPHDAEQIARSALSFSKMITDPEMVANLGESSKTVTANTFVTPKEMIFLQEAIKMADPSILDKPSYMQKYLVDCLHVFHQHVNGQTYNTLKPLIKVYPFIKQLLINYVATAV